MLDFPNFNYNKMRRPGNQAGPHGRDLSYVSLVTVPFLQQWLLGPKELLSGKQANLEVTV